MKKSNILLFKILLFSFFIFISSNCLTVETNRNDNNIQYRISNTFKTAGIQQEEFFSNTDIPEPSSSATSASPIPLSASEQASIYWGYVTTLWHTIESQISDSSISSNHAPSFELISKNILARTYTSNDQSFDQSSFISDFENVSGGKFIDGNSIKFLIDGEESFRYKDYLIKNAKKSIFISSWAFYDDITGADALNMLVIKQKEGVDINIIVDGNIIKSHGVSIIRRMEKAGIKVIRHKEKDRKSDIWHVKMIVIDNKYAILGGMNFGDPYSHKNPNGQKWRDTDVLFTGPAVSKASEIFAEIWNDELKKNSLKFPELPYHFKSSQSNGNTKISFSFSNPPEEFGSPILSAIIKAIRGARKKINIENAYFVPIPALTEALLEARARGVEVNIFTNSKESIDAEAKPLADVSMKSLFPLFKSGAGIYLKKGDTLHSKFMTVDGIFVSIGSYNLHPRSERYDTELNINIIDKENAQYLDKVFEHDITTLATRVNSESELVPDSSIISEITEKYFFSQLNKTKQN
ncbi:MAG: phosphatidylserine/phosphatidylglycerophosphate/cardiolipin synthase family protein [Elusimicrobia bacterium]|nr:phosphatidylserine/phosphatidylglycerophosphate/cardiolipin synthase family protein [Elusimicrobiota bacterium]